MKLTESNQKSPSPEEITQFINALQLSIKSQVGRYTIPSSNQMIIHFDSVEEDDQGLLSFQQLFPGQWNKQRNSYFIQDTHLVDWQLVTHFLMLSRLQKDNMQKLAELDNKFYSLLKKANLTKTINKQDKTITTLVDAVDIVFSAIAKQKLTLRQVSELTGLTQVSLSNFKAKRDIRFGNLLKILNALGLKLKVED
ncbi:MAG: helix-turn-helix transcriptional regulator [Deltaproteobacteria bacterium]|nr:helix-turn-helix transcriptional regulator [Deltaproteobacteria bacterium]